MAQKQKQEEKSYTDTALIDHPRVMLSPTTKVAKKRVKKSKNADKKSGVEKLMHAKPYIFLRSS